MHKSNKFILKDLKRFMRFLSRSDTHYQKFSTCETLVIYLEHGLIGLDGLPLSNNKSVYI